MRDFSLGGSTEPHPTPQKDTVNILNKLSEVSDHVKTLLNGKKGSHYYFRRRRNGGEAISPIGEPLY